MYGLLYKQIIYVVLIFGLSIGLYACNNGGTASSSTNTTVYGQYIAESSAGPDLTKDELQTFFESQVVCFGIFAPDIKANEYCQANNTYLNNDPIFGISTVSGLRVDNFVLNTEPNINSIAREQLIYNTPGQPNLVTGSVAANEIVSGLVLLPQDASGNYIAESQIKGVLLYFHGTIASKAGVPSGYGNQESSAITSSNHSQSMLGAVYANSGYIVVAPDYVGQGIDIVPVHPFVVFPQVNATSGIYMLSALKTFLANKGINISRINNGEPNLYISSYSEGGAYALWTSQLIQTSYANFINDIGLQLQRTVGASGAYNITDVTLPFLFSDTPNGLEIGQNPWDVSPGCDANANMLSSTACGNPSRQSLALATGQLQLATARAPLAAEAMNSLISYNYTAATYDLFMVPDFVQQTTCVNPVSIVDESFVFESCSTIPVSEGGTGGTYTLPDLFNYNGLSAGQIDTQLLAAASGTTYYLIESTTNVTSLLQNLAQGDVYNTVAAFIYPSVLQNPSFESYAAAANIYNWTTMSPISIIYLKYDSVVPNLNSKSACDPDNPSLLSNSASGLVTCIEDHGISGTIHTPGIDNTNLWTVEGVIPTYLNHIWSEGILQVVALSQIQQ